MKIIIHEGIENNEKEFRKYVPTRYLPAIGKLKSASKVTLVIFPVNVHVVTTGYVNKALKRIKNKEIPNIWLAWSFSVEAHDIIEANQGNAVSVGNYEWQEDRWNIVHGGSS